MHPLLGLKPVDRTLSSSPIAVVVIFHNLVAREFVVSNSSEKLFSVVVVVVVAIISGVVMVGLEPERDRSMKWRHLVKEAVEK
jgi:hypothetical protein